jgi:hypothetical protein
MQGRLVRAVAAALGAAAFIAAFAQESVLDQPPDRESWPAEITRRPLTLAPGMVELNVPVHVNASTHSFGQPVSIAPSVYYGAAQRVTVGLRHFRGLCVTGTSNGCPEVYDDVSIDSIWGLTRDLALGLALDAGPFDPFALAVEGRIVARLASGPVALTIAPSLNVGVTERDTLLSAARQKPLPLAFPLATTTWGFFQQERGNKEFLAVPVSLTVEAVPKVAVSIASALDGPLESSAAGVGFGDVYTVPLGAAVIATPNRGFDLGASFTLLNLFGKNGGGDARALQLFAAYRD